MKTAMRKLGTIGDAAADILAALLVEAAAQELAAETGAMGTPIPVTRKPARDQRCKTTA